MSSITNKNKRVLRFIIIKKMYLDLVIILWNFKKFFFNYAMQIANLLYSSTIVK